MSEKFTVGGVTYERRQVTPEVAANWLLKDNNNNRRMRDTTVEAYAADMASGAWKENGAAIRFAKDGTLLDGQHRLSAVVASNTIQEFLIVTGLDSDSQITMDTGMKRTFSDWLKMNGTSNYVIVASITRRLVMWDRGVRRHTGRVAGITNHQLINYLDKNPGVHVSARECVRVQGHIKLAASVLGTCHFLFNRIDTFDCAKFCDLLVSGADMGPYHPVLQLRKQIQRNNESTTSRFTDEYLTAITIKSWNHFRAGTEVQILKWIAGGAQPEAMPEPK